MRWYANLQMQAKLMSAFVGMSALMMLVGALGLADMASSNRALDRLYGNEMVGAASAQDLRSLIYDVGRLYRQVLLDPAGDAARDNAGKIETNLVAIDQHIATLDKVQLDPAERQALDQIRAVLPDWRERVGQTVTHAREGDLQAAREAAAGNGQNAGVLVKNLVALTASFAESGTAAVKGADHEIARARATMVVVLVAGLLLGLGMGFSIARMVSRPLADAVRVLGRVAEGDFTQTLELDTRDELGQMAQALNSAVAGVRTSLREVRTSFDAVATASRELSASSDSISSGAQEQASSLEETAASLEQITSTVQQNADNSQQASQIALGAREIAEKGGAVVGMAVTAMREINASSKHIAEIITTIDEIAFQTNLLALNAAVEAARAGEQGRGFAVVAGEVRNLAQRSASAAKEIKGLIQDSVEKVESGTELVNRSGTTLEEIVGAVKRVTEIVGEIAAASREQSVGIGQVGTAVTQMDAVTQANAAQTEELAGTAETLSAHATQLQALVARYKLDGQSAEVASA